jgi:stringent starvation protein A
MARFFFSGAQMPLGHTAGLTKAIYLDGLRRGNAPFSLERTTPAVQAQVNGPTRMCRRRQFLTHCRCRPLRSRTDRGSSREQTPVMTLYSDPLCPYCHRVRMVLAEKGITVEMVDVDSNDLPDELMDFNPYGTVPTLVDRDLRLYESRIIMEYLDERFPHPPLLPVDPVSRATARLFMYRVDQDWYAAMDKIKKGSDSEAEQARKELRESLTATAPVFAAHPFFMSEELSLVDCCVAPLLWRLHSLGIEVPARAKGLHAYASRIFAWDAFRRSLSEEEQELAAD